MRISSSLRSRNTLSPAAFLAALLVSGAFPVTFAAPAAADANDSGELASIVVTAQRRQESAQEVPISLSTLTSDDLAARDVKTVNDIAYLAPSVQVEPQFGSGQVSFRIRGVGFNDYASNNSPTVGVYVDEVAYPLPVQTQGLLFDINRVEILRGPQGTLYGRNTTGGAINFLTADPTAQLAAGINTDYTSHELFRAEGYLSGPVNDNVRLRLSAVTEQGGSWQESRSTGQDLGDKNASAVRLKADIDVTAQLKLKLNAHYGLDKSDGLGAYLLPQKATANASGVVPPPADTDHTKTDWGVSPLFVSLNGVRSDGKPNRDNKTYGFDATALADLGAVKVTNIAAYEDLERRELNDWSGTVYSIANTFFHTDARVISEELRLSGNIEGPLQWVAGLYYSNERLADSYNSDFVDSLGFDTRLGYTQIVHSYSGFGQVEYHFTPQLKALAGIRYEWENRKFEDPTFLLFLPGPTPVPFTLPNNYSTSFSKPSGKVGLEYQVTEPVLLYSTISRGVKSGGFTAYNSTNSAAFLPFKPEEVLTYEVGFKSDLAERTLRLNGALYYDDYRDQQVQSAVDTTNGLVGVFVNAPRSLIYGGELELDAAPAHGLLLSAGLGYAKGKYLEFTDLDAAATAVAGQAVYVSKNGRDLGFPKLTFNSSASYERDVFGWRWTPRVDYSYRSRQTSTFDGQLGANFDIGGYGLLDASLSVRPASAPWSLAVFGKNVLDKRYDVTRNFFTTTALGFSGERGYVGLRFQYNL
jgi:iron complex outermembrane recepter protein